MTCDDDQYLCGRGVYDVSLVVDNNIMSGTNVGEYRTTSIYISHLSAYYFRVSFC